ncbi:YcaO-like family protein [Stappia sp. TSB10P1A]|uniref:YcaO-like family protein n=1 Tax=Stappia sp. TSB10P1A TaxID=2003585 RepID=UPI001643ED49|nr:YcaO-like family protein [Stappia sp. TSB10P1A]
MDGDEAALRFLAYLAEGDPARLAGDRDLAALLAVAARLERLFELALPDAPGLYCFGAEVRPEEFGAAPGARGSLSGVGETRLAAFRACVGEAVEYLAQFEPRPGTAGAAVTEAEAEATSGDDVLAAAPGGAFWTEAESRALGLGPGTEGNASRAAAEGDGDRSRLLPDERVPAVDLASGARGTVPAALCWRRRPGDALPLARGLGVAAGRSFREACRHAMLEWIERDAVALWWRGGRKGRAVALETLTAPEVAGRIARWRGGRDGRLSWFLDLTTDLGVPVAAALSVDREGKRFAYGFSARPTLEQALVSAFAELAQVELADRVVDAKLAEAGEGRLNDTDRLHLARRSLVKPDWDALQPAAAPGSGAAGGAGLREASGGAVDPLSCLSLRNFRVLAIDLTRTDPGISVARVLVPGLQPDPAALTTPRLERQRGLRPSAGFPGDGVRLY